MLQFDFLVINAASRSSVELLLFALSSVLSLLVSLSSSLVISSTSSSQFSSVFSGIRFEFIRDERTFRINLCG